MISAELLREVTDWLGGAAQSATLQQDLRAEFPGMHFTFCSDDDVMSENPVASEHGFNLYLIDSSNHCLALTTDLEQASGLVIAEIEEE